MRERSITVKFSEAEDLWLRQEACALNMDLTEVIRKCLTLGIPLLKSSDFIRRVQLQDVMNKDLML